MTGDGIVILHRENNLLLWCRKHAAPLFLCAKFNSFISKFNSFISYAKIKIKEYLIRSRMR